MYRANAKLLSTNVDKLVAIDENQLVWIQTGKAELEAHPITGEPLYISPCKKSDPDAHVKAKMIWRLVYIEEDGIYCDWEKLCIEK